MATGARLRVAPVFLDGLLNNFEQVVDAIIGYAYGPGTDPTIIREGARIMKEPGQEVIHNDFLACDRFDSREDLANIRLPCLILCGSEDKLTPKKLSQSLNREINGSTLRIISGAGHMIMIERCNEFNGAVQDFIMGLGP